MEVAVRVERKPTRVCSVEILQMPVCLGLLSMRPGSPGSPEFILHTNGSFPLGGVREHQGHCPRLYLIWASGV